MELLKNKIKCIATLGLSLAFVLGSCSDAKYSELRGQAFISQTGTAGNKSQNIVLAEDAVTVELNVRLSDPLDKAGKYALVLDETVLEAYNQRNGAKLTMLPESMVAFSAKEVELQAGVTVSTPIQLTVTPLTKELLSTGDTYAIPVRLKALDGAAPLVPGGDEFVYTIKPVIISSVPVLGSDPKNGYVKAKALGVNPVALSAWTVEFRVNMSSFLINNQAIFGSWGEGNSEIYIRFGDAGTPFNTLQVKFAGTQFDKSNTVFVPNRWYHIAVVYDGTTVALYVDGKKDLDTDKKAGHVFNLDKELSICGSGSTYFYAGAMLHEFRIWNVARTPLQLTENEYSVSPTTPGLLHYWRMNEGEGGEFKNMVQGAPSLKTMDGYNVEKTPRWLGNVRSDGKGRTSIND